MQFTTILFGALSVTFAMADFQIYSFVDTTGGDPSQGLSGASGFVFVPSGKLIPYPLSLETALTHTKNPHATTSITAQTSSVWMT